MGQFDESRIRQLPFKTEETNQLKVRNIMVIDTFVGDQYNITWEYDNFLNPNFVEFIIRRSPNRVSEFREIGRTSQLFFLDIKADRALSRTYYYTVEPLVTSLTTVDSIPVSWEGDSQRWQNHNILKARVEDLLWIINKGGFAETTQVLKKRVSGTRCAATTAKNVTSRRGFVSKGEDKGTKSAEGFFGWNPTPPVNEKNTGENDYQEIEHDAQNCPQCFGTGFQGGFEKLVGGCDISRTSPTVENQISRQQGIQTSHLQEWWGLAHPYLHDGDLLVRGNNLRFQVVDITRADPINGFILWQSFNLIEIQPTDIKYRVII